MLLLLCVLISGTFIISLTHREKARTQPQGEESPLTPPVEGKPELIPLLIAYDDDHAMRWRNAQAVLPQDSSLRAKQILRTLLIQYLQTPSPHPLAKGSDIKEVYLINNSTAVIDTTAQFADGHPSGILLEELTLASLIETLSANMPGIVRVKFLVNGKERETLAGHADLTSFYESSAVHELAKEYE
ncbi:MAG TPA: GerMN domain-containing protein [Candidatus Angelobacter sp.]|nr:GerMN domain-containing protein [Candidatus Angelobacter sp.]